MLKITIFLVGLAFSHAVHSDVFQFSETQQRQSRQRAPTDDHRPGTPYRFVYGSSSKDGTHGREEMSDEDGTVRGSYRISLADGRMRVVKYIADKNGFRAGIATNEQGTESASSSGVVIHSEALPGADAARAAEKSRLASMAASNRKQSVFFDN
uniref:Uncharacterized protein n=2 Tax=Ixodes ricinus TaxID=34613 RepID=V5GJT1_IXORI